MLWRFLSSTLVGFGAGCLWLLVGHHIGNIRTEVLVATMPPYLGAAVLGSGIGYLVTLLVEGRK